MRSIETISTAIHEMADYCEWHDGLDPTGESLLDTHTGLQEFSQEDWQAVVDGGGIVEYWDGVAVTLCTPTVAGLAPGVAKAVMVVDGYVYGLDSWEELQALQEYNQSDAYQN